MLALVGSALDRIAPLRGVVFDGYPRNLAQAESLEGIRRIDLVIDLDIPVSRVIRRLEARARADDRGDAIEARLRAFEEDTRPMLRRFDAAGHPRHDRR